jgi:hypothetical protein
MDGETGQSDASELRQQRDQPTRRALGIHPPWRAMGLGSCAISAPAVTCFSHPILGQVLAGCEAAAAMITFATALFGSPTTSERAFRLMRWLANRPEPGATSRTDVSPAPPAVRPAADRRPADS